MKYDQDKYTTETFKQKISDNDSICLYHLSELDDYGFALLRRDIKKVSNNKVRYWFEHELELKDLFLKSIDNECFILSLLLYLCYDEYIPPRFFNVTVTGGEIGIYSITPGISIKIGSKLIQRIEISKTRIPEELCYEFELEVISTQSPWEKLKKEVVIL